MSIRHQLVAAAIAVAAWRPTDTVAETRLTETTTAVFATAEEGRKLLGARDEFVERMSPFDRAARLKTDREVSEAGYFDFVAENVVEWADAEKAKLEGAIAGIRPRLAQLAVPLPETVQLIRTTGQEEGGAFYTRGAAIVFPTRRLAAASDDELKRTLAHELFHVLSRAEPELKEKLYATIGFEPCGDVELPGDLADRRITNPDAPRNDHAIQLRIEGQERWAVHVIYSRAAKYDVQAGGEFFQYLEFRFLAVDRDAEGKATPIRVDGRPLLVEPSAVGGLYEQIGRNTVYIIHPEEILADNFALLVLEASDVQSPDVLARIEKALREHVSASAGSTPPVGE
jgi:hypothetical protein